MMTVASASTIHPSAALPLRPSAARVLGRGIAIAVALAVYGLLALHLLVSAVGLGHGPGDADATSTARPAVERVNDLQPAAPVRAIEAPARPVPGFSPD